MVDSVSLAHAFTRLEGLLRIFLSPHQHHQCVPLLRELHAAIGVLARPRLGAVASEDVSDEALRQRFRLTRREVEVLRLLLRGESNSGVAHGLHLSEHTAHHHTERVLRKLQVHSRARLRAAIAARLG
ncbi:MAG TPA: helix-turn-helix transcriptional regulator [Gemmatimonadales bacterium]|nr:helix-turn-helix transcriptional regulator [Gemmatimonadales bacterium]